MGDPVFQHYHVSIEPDLARFAFRGSVRIGLHSERPLDRFFVHALDLAIDTCTVIDDSGRRPCVVDLNPETEHLTVVLPEAMAGPITVAIDYRGTINDRMAGFYRSAYTHGDQTHWMAVTQFQESDARRAFPCMDHPREKATFQIEMIIDPGLSAISNTPEETVETRADGKKRVVFARTPKMSTYLVFFAVGEFAVAVDSGDARIRSVSLPGKDAYTAFGREFARKALGYLEDYTAIPYPLAKLDLIAIPDFAYGAMENWGAITYRENLLLHYPESTSSLGAMRICEVTAHELVHQWFGNLVTPSDWTYLWLNESFATLFGYGVVDHFYPGWDVWDQFIDGQTAAALGRDSLTDTFPIEIPGGEHVVINTATAPIIYSKGGSILRMIRAFMGEETFRAGLRHYLSSHAYANAGSDAFWEAFDATSTLPVTRIMKSWVEQPGFPVIRASREEDRLILSQTRYSCLPNPSTAQWQVPVTVRCFFRDGASDTRKVLLEGTDGELVLPPDTTAYLVNDDQTGFYHVADNDPENRAAIEALIRTRQLPPRDRWGVQNDCYAGVRSTAVPLDAYLSLVEAAYVGEKDFLPLSGVVTNLYEALLVTDGAVRERVRAVGGRVLSAALGAMGTEPRDGEAHTRSILRDRLLWHAAVHGAESILPEVRRLGDALRNGGKVHPDIVKGVLQVAAHDGDAATLAWLIARYEAAESEHERMNVLTAMGCFADSDVQGQALSWVLDTVPDRIRFLPIAMAAANPAMVGGIWSWYVDHRERLENGHPLLYERIIASVVPVGGMADPDAVRAFCKKLAARPQAPVAAIRLSLEKLEINLRLRAAAGKNPRA